MVRALNNLFQAIHHEHLDPPTRFFLHSTVTTDDDGEFWQVRLYATVQGKLEVWISKIETEEMSAKESILLEAIQGGMLHVNVKGKKGIKRDSKLDLQFLQRDEEPITIPLDPLDDPGDSGILLDAALTLLARTTAGGKGDKAELRNLRTQIAKKDEEISALHTRMASLKATVVRATASDNNRKKVQASPQKPKGASAMQPNAKRRKAVEDEFAGSDSE